MSDKNSMVFFYNWIELFEELSDAEVGQLVRAAVQYDQTGEDPDLPDKSLRIVFKAMKNSINISNEKYRQTCEKRKKAIEKRWGKKDSEPIQMNTNVYNSIERNTKYTDTDTDTDIDTDTDTDTDSGSGSGSGNNAAHSKTADAVSTQPQPPLFNEIVSSWNGQTCTKTINRLTASRIKLIRECEADLYDFLAVVNRLDDQEYLVQMAKEGKPVTFDWFIRPENYQKVADGNYEHIRGGGYGSRTDWEAVGRHLDSLSELSG